MFGLSLRLILLLIFAASMASIVITQIMQHVFDMEPCPLCITQRVFVIAVGFSAFLAALLVKFTLIMRTFSSLGILLGVVGASVSARHIWIQNLPEDQVPDCGPGLAYMFETRPLFEALDLLFKGDGNCADIHFTLLGLSIPAWTFLFFVFLITALIFVLHRSLREKA